MRNGCRTILVVGDDEGVRAGATNALGSLDCRVVTAGDAGAALAMIHSDGSIAGYAAGVERKRVLLQREAAQRAAA